MHYLQYNTPRGFGLQIRPVGIPEKSARQPGHKERLRMPVSLKLDASGCDGSLFLLGARSGVGGRGCRCYRNSAGR